MAALHNLGEAYLSVMEARARGELAGEARDAATATRDWANAVRGAVAKARARGKPVAPRVDENDALVYLGADALDPNTAPLSAASGPHYWPRYRPQYTPRWTGRHGG